MADASGPKHLNAVLGRAKLEEMAQDIIQKTSTTSLLCSGRYLYAKNVLFPPVTVDITAECVQEAGLTMADITTVLAVGGMTKMPKIRESLMALTEKEPLKGINPDEAVAYGCAMQGEVQVESYDKVEITDTLALSIGVEVAGGVYVKMIPAGTTSPCRRTMRFSTHSDNQKKVEIKVYQGERALAKDNVHVTTAVIDNLPPMPKGFPQIELTIEIDAVGTIYVMTKELLTDKQDIRSCPSSLLFISNS
jgi:molecular chaperone DnaK